MNASRYTQRKLAVVLFAVALCLVYLLSIPAIAQDSNYLCYWGNSDGSVIDLSPLCQQTTTTTRSPKATFLVDFRAMASRYPDSIRQQLDKYTNENGDSAIASAKTTCRVLKYGGTTAELKRRQSLASYDSSPSAQARLQTIYALAINHYCPEFANR